ncbi:MAG: hypothetical protein P8188_07915 [Gemmatimonadota bacterium]|jgi:P pilus assembly chaperone PapD
MKLRSLARSLSWTTLLLALGLVTEAVAIVVAPTAIYLDDADPAAVIQLYNPSSRPEEVSVEALFGFPTTDEEGRLRLDLVEGDDPRSAAEWVRVLPRRLVVPPGERRAVRLLAQPPAGLADGEYWTRLVFTSRGQEIPVGGADAEGVQVGLGLEVRTIIALTYRKGAVSTGLEVRGFDPHIQGDSLVVRPELLRRENGAFIGLMELSLLDADSIPVRQWNEQVAVYRTYHRRFAYDVHGLPRGEYRLVARLGTEREDVDPKDRLVTPAVELVAPVVLP